MPIAPDRIACHAKNGKPACPIEALSGRRGKTVRLSFRGDAAFANPEIHEVLEADGMGYVIWLSANGVLQFRA